MEMYSGEVLHIVAKESVIKLQGRMKGRNAPEGFGLALVEKSTVQKNH